MDSADLKRTYLLITFSSEFLVVLMILILYLMGGFTLFENWQVMAVKMPIALLSTTLFFRIARNPYLIIRQNLRFPYNLAGLLFYVSLQLFSFALIFIFALTNAVSFQTLIISLGITESLKAALFGSYTIDLFSKF